MLFFNDSNLLSDVDAYCKKYSITPSNHKMMVKVAKQLGRNSAGCTAMDIAKKLGIHNQPHALNEEARRNDRFFRSVGMGE